MLSNNDYYHPEEVLQHISEQEAQLLTAIDVQTILQLLIKNQIVTLEEVNEMRQKVSNLPKYRATIDTLQKERKAMEAAQKDPQAYLKAMMKAKLDGTLK